MRAPLRGGSQLARFYPKRHLRSGLVSPIQGAPNSAGTSLYRRLSLPRLKQLKENKKIENILCPLSFVLCPLSFGVWPFPARCSSAEWRNVG